MTKGWKQKKIIKETWGTLPWLMLIILLIIASVLGIRIKKRKEQIEEEKLAAYKENRPPVNIVVQEVLPRQIIDRINLPATIAPWEDLTVSAQVSGTIISIHAIEGDVVKSGDMLARIDPRDYENQLKQVQASFDLAHLEYERMFKLRETNAVSQSQLDTIQSRLEEISSALSSAKLDLERCKITAPISGFINKRLAKEGLLVSRSDPLFQILDTEQVKVEVGIPEADVYAISKLERAEIIVEALDGLKVKGEKVFLSRQPETFARVYNLKLKVDNPDNRLRPGMFARVDLIKEKYEDSLVVPLYSIITDGEKNYLYIVNDETAHYREVKLGILEGWNVQITQGLDPNDRVVVVGQRNLEDGQKVSVIQTITDPMVIDK